MVYTKEDSYSRFYNDSQIERRNIKKLFVNLFKLLKFFLSKFRLYLNFLTYKTFKIILSLSQVEDFDMEIGLVN